MNRIESGESTKHITHQLNYVVLRSYLLSTSKILAAKKGWVQGAYLI